MPRKHQWTAVFLGGFTVIAGLDIKFFYNPELNKHVTLRPDGRFSMQHTIENDYTRKLAALKKNINKLEEK